MFHNKLLPCLTYFFFLLSFFLVLEVVGCQAQSTPLAFSQLSAGKNASVASNLNRVSQPSAEQPVVSSNPAEISDREVSEEVPFEDVVEIRSVYVRNLPSTATEYEIEEEIKKFGQIYPDGMVIRSHRDVGVCYAFVKYEEMSGVHHNAVKCENLKTEAAMFAKHLSRA